MTDPRKQAWQPYVRSAADAFGLKDVPIEVGDDPPPPDAAASACMSYSLGEALILLSESFLAMPPCQQRHIIAHELLHIKAMAVHEAIDDELEGAVHRAVERPMERFIESLARLLAPTLPLPDLGEEDEECDTSLRVCSPG